MPGPLELGGLVASAGFARGAAFRERAGEARYVPKGSPEAERAALAVAIADAVAATAEIVAVAEGDATDILAFQLAMLEDDAFGAAASHRIDAGETADAAWMAALDEEIAAYRASEDENFAARAADLVDIRDRVLAALTGSAETAIPAGAILVADDITPSRFLGHDWSGGGIVLARGSASGHAAILARQRGVTMLVGVAIDAIGEGDPLLVDGLTGRVIAHPDAAALAAHEAAERRHAAERALHAAHASGDARTADGRRISVMINMGDPSDVESIAVAHVDGVGLMRTEFLFGHGLPDEETQFRAYRKVLDWAKGKPVTIRTVDAGGDKPIPGFTESEDNPFLGVRGIRLCLARPDIFRVQIRALLRAAPHGALKVMLPMVAVPDEISAAATLFAEEAGKLAAAGVAHTIPPLGIMVEVPSVAILPERFGEAAFFSIGSNDLTQYVLAASRDNHRLAALARADDPAVLALVARVAACGAATGRGVSLCGDAASQPAIVPRLLAAGLRILSVNPSAIGAVKAAIAAVDLRQGG